MNTLLIKAGACYESAKGTFSRCALQSSDCNSIEDSSQSMEMIYRTSYWMEAEDPNQAIECSKQSMIHSIPAMGRCDSASERYICTSHPTACRFHTNFKPYQNDCTVLEDLRPVDTPFTRSYYGLCEPKDSQEVSEINPQFAAWQFSDCPIDTGLYSFRSADPFFAEQNPEEQCDNVWTGACVSTDSVTNENIVFCAITEDVCEIQNADGGNFRYLKPLEVRDVVGNVCRLCDNLPPPPTVEYAKAGACVDIQTQTAVTKCALSPSNCNSESETFLSPRSLLDPSLRPASLSSAQAEACLSQEAVQHQVNVGRCVSDADLNICTSDATSCIVSQNFQPNDPDCFVVEDKSTMGDNAQFSNTYYGHCTPDDFAVMYQPGRETYCAWSFQDWKATDTTARKYNFADANPGMSGTFPNCRCDDVRIGACINDSDDSDVYCAVAADACDGGYTFAPVRDLEVPFGPNRVCYLCSELPADPTTSPPETVPTPVSEPSPQPASPDGGPTSGSFPVVSPTRSPVQQQPVMSPTSTIGVASNGSSDKLSTGALVGIVIGSLIGAGLITVVLAMFAKRHKHNSTPDINTTARMSSRFMQDNNNVMAQAEMSDDMVSETDIVIEEGLPSSSKTTMQPGQVESDLVPVDDHSVQ